MKKFLLSIILILSLTSLVFADTNGIWNYASDVRPGVFGSDEYAGNYSFNSSVGIGTTNPNMKLEVVGDTGIPVAIGIKAAVGQRAYLSLSSDNGNLGNRWSIGTAVDNSLYFFNAKQNTYQLNIQDDGDVIVPYNLAVGASDLAPGFKLDVNGKIRMRSQTLITDSVDTVATKKYVDDNSGTSVDGQWSSVKSARELGVSYQNTNDAVIFVTVDMGDYGFVKVSDDGSIWLQLNTPSSDRGTFTFPVRPGGWYIYDDTSGPSKPSYWHEFRIN
ncbi:MAG: hypothetical protein PF569_05015 [Candidatus Woesearchaeota archaeon]|jgi:hypothetical protein|nr:hypothetical protein [Candidatus Woesearchaeota archaeon]